MRVAMMKLPWMIMLACFVWPALAGAAHAEGPCPPGFYPTGGGQSGWHACAPMGPMEEEEEPYSEAEAGYNGSGYSSSTHFDPAQWAEWARAAQEAEAAPCACVILRIGIYDRGSGISLMIDRQRRRSAQRDSSRLGAACS